MNNKNKFSYRVNNRAGAKNISVRIGADGSVVVTKPYFVNKVFVNNFINKNSKWITDKLHQQSSNIELFNKRKENYIKDKVKARSYIIKKVDVWAQIIGVDYNRISIKNQITVWGSCSRKKNLNFSYRLLYLPSDIADYIIVHELCHLIELNHSKKFWSNVEKYIPDYNQKRKLLRKIK